MIFEWLYLLALSVYCCMPDVRSLFHTQGVATFGSASLIEPLLMMAILFEKLGSVHVHVHF